MTVSDQAAVAARRRQRKINPWLAVLALFLVVLFAGLGTWQVVRLRWKLDLIARVDARLAAPPVPLPGRARWPGISAGADEYRRVILTGSYRYDLTTPVQALTEEGNGYWLMTPMCLADGPAGEAGGVVLVNRGFIATELGAPTRYAPARAQGDACAPARTPAGSPTATPAVGAPAVGMPDKVVGLLRIDERAGAFTRSNDPAANRWYARDVAQIAAARGLDVRTVAPFFVDAARGQNPLGSPDAPTGGMTVVRFHNSHLVYAITWYALALMVGAGFWWVVRGAAGLDDTSDERDDGRDDDRHH